MSTTSVDVSEVRAFLEQHLGPGVGDVQWVGDGAWSRCFGFADEAGDWVVRFGAHGDDFEADRRAATFAGAALPIPAVREIGRAFGGWYAISSRVRGEVLEALSAAAWRAVLPSLFATLDAMRAVEAPGSGFGGWDAGGDGTEASWRDFLLAVDRDEPGDRTHGWQRRLAASRPDAAVFRAGLARLGELVDALPPERHLVHGDLVNRNVLVADDRIAGIFDWGCALWGDFLYDLAWLEVWSPWHPGLAALDIRSEGRRHLEGVGVALPDFAARMLAYRLHIGLAHQAYQAWQGSESDLAEMTRLVARLLDERP